MSEDRIILITIFSYLVIIGIPLVRYIDKGRQSGKVTPRLSATLIALFLIGVPWLVISIVFWPGFTPVSFLLCGLGVLGFLFVWLGAYAGPLGAGWTGRWKHYVYPSRGKGKQEQP